MRIHNRHDGRQPGAPTPWWVTLLTIGYWALITIGLIKGVGVIVSALASEHACQARLTLDCASNPDVIEIAGPAKITDGDTLSIGPAAVRLYGIDAPEAGQKCQTAAGKSWRCGDEVTARLSALTEGHEVRCLSQERDSYGRLLATCWAGTTELNATLVSEGLAWAFVKYSDAYSPLEARARSAALGVWQGDAEAPWDYRANRWARAAEASPRPGCPIKGNISRDGEMIYHTPWSPWYSRTRINAAKGERWFCDEQEALAAGWRPARWN